MKKDTWELRDRMNGMEYKNHRGDIAKVINVCVTGGGHSVVFNYGAEHNVVCALGKFMNRYPIKVES